MSDAPRCLSPMFLFVYLLFTCLFPDNGYLAILLQLNNRTWRMGLVLLSSRPANIVYCIEYLLANVAEVRCCRLSTHVGTRAHQRLLESVAELMRERLLG